MNPNMNVPTKAPILLIELIHEISSFDMGPVINGVLSDNNIGNAGLNHPTMHP